MVQQDAVGPGSAEDGESELAGKVAEHWEQIEGFPRNVLAFARSAVPALLHFGAWTDDELWAAMEAHRAALAGQGDPGEGEESYVDLRTEEWEVFSAACHPAPTPDFALHRPGVAPDLSEFVDDVVQAERLREARALVGFSRLDAHDPEDPERRQDRATEPVGSPRVGAGVGGARRGAVRPLARAVAVRVGDRR